MKSQIHHLVTYKPPKPIPLRDVDFPQQHGAIGSDGFTPVTEDIRSSVLIQVVLVFKAVEDFTGAHLPRGFGNLGVIGEVRVLYHGMGHIHPEAIHSLVTPKLQNFIESRLNFGVAPVQIWLLRQEQMAVVLLSVGVKVQAGPPKCDTQLLGGPPSGAGSFQIYQSLLGLERLLLDSWNQAC